MRFTYIKIIIIYFLFFQHFNILAQCTFTNPVKSGSAPDPFVTYKDGYYYGCYTTGGNVTIWKNQNLQNIFQGQSANVWGGKPNIWAPELHYFNGKWYIYTCFDSGQYWFHIVVLEANTADPLGAYTLKAELDGLSNCIDATAWQDPTNGQIYMAYSRMDGTSKMQEIWITKMSNPWTLQGTAVRLSYPQNTWEMQPYGVNEGPEFLLHGSKLNIIFSASQCHYEDYCLASLSANVGSDYMNPTSWTKSSTPLFKKSVANDAYAVGHHSCVQTPNGEWWLVYHGKYGAIKNTMNAARDPRMQQFTWNGDVPIFGDPVACGTSLVCPGSGIINPPPSTSTTCWHFNSDLEGWNTPNLMSSTVVSSIATLTITGGDPYFYSPDNLKNLASDYKYIVLSMQNQTSSSQAEFFWTTTTQTGFDQTKRVIIPIIANDTRQRYYIVDLSANANWTGTIKQIRLDPTTNVTSGTIKLDFIKFADAYNNIKNVPGILEAEDFNKGGEGNAYHDVDSANNGGKYRTSEGVDIETTGDVNGTYNLGWTAAGEWLEYLINVQQTGSYNIMLRTSAPGISASVKLYIDGQQQGGNVTLTQTAGYQIYADVTITATLTQGLHIFKIQNVTDGFNLNKITFIDNNTIGIEEKQDPSDLLVYPNPTLDRITIVCKDALYVTLQITDIQGKIIAVPVKANNFLPQQSSISIDVSSLAPGQYFIKVTDRKKSFMRKFIKQ